MTADDVYLRFHGTQRRYHHDYMNEELGTWVKRILDSGAKNVWAYFNNDREGFAIKNARQLVRACKHLKQRKYNVVRHPSFRHDFDAVPLVGTGNSACELRSPRASHVVQVKCDNVTKIFDSLLTHVLDGPVHLNSEMATLVDILVVLRQDKSVRLHADLIV